MKVRITVLYVNIPERIVNPASSMMDPISDFISRSFFIPRNAAPPVIGIPSKIALKILSNSRSLKRRRIENVIPNLLTPGMNASGRNKPMMLHSYVFSEIRLFSRFCKLQIYMNMLAEKFMKITYVFSISLDFMNFPRIIVGKMRMSEFIIIF